MKDSLSQVEIHKILNSYNFDIGKCINYFLDELGFEWAVVFKDKPGFQLDYHFHKSDDYLYMIEWVFISEVAGELKILHKWDFIVVPKWFIHDVRPTNTGAKYIVATEDGNFETIFI